MKSVFFFGIILSVIFTGDLMAENFDPKRRRMVTEQIESRGVKDPLVLQVMRKIERHHFVPPESAADAYEDYPLPIGNDQTISQPYIVAYMTEALSLNPTDRVLEIGTGSGYQAAILAELAGEVFTIEIIPELAHEAQTRLKRLGYKNIHVRAGDGYLGWPEKGPFDAVIVTAAPEKIPQALVDQLNPDGGRMIVPVGSGSQELVLVTKTAQGIHEKRLLPVRFVPMVQDKEGQS